MREGLSLSLGGLSIRLTPDPVSRDYAEVNRAVDFFHPDKPDVVIQVHCGGFPDLSAGDLVFDSEQGWQLKRREKDWVITTRSIDNDPRQVGVFADDFLSGDIYVAESKQNPGQFIFPLSPLLGELFMINLLGTGLGMLAHAAGVIEHGKGYLFTGNGGAGKSTTARLWQGRPEVSVVNDDKVILRKIDGRFRLFGTPWHGVGGNALPLDAPLERVFVLKQAPRNYLRRLEPAEAVADMVKRAFVPLWSEARMTNTVQFLDELRQHVPVYELGFLPDASAVEFVQGLD